MLKQSCLVCKVVGAIAIIGALNWGAIALLHVNFVEHIFGVGSNITRLIYAAVGISGLLLFLSYFIVCPACKK